jgi:hypothetical protein
LKEHQSTEKLFEKFRSLVQYKFKINFDDEIDSEDEPVIVSFEELSKHWTEEERQQFLNS